MKKLLVLVFSCVVFIAASGNVLAANIVFTISGTLDVQIDGENTVYADRLVTWNFFADTEHIYTFGGTFGVPSMLRIDGITGTVEIDGLLSESQLSGAFDIASSIEGATEPGVALSLTGGTTPIIWLNNAALNNYGLDTEIGSLTCEIEGAPHNGPYETVDEGTFAVASLLSADISFEAAFVPLPSSLLLLGAGLASLAGLRRKFRQV